VLEHAAHNSGRPLAVLVNLAQVLAHVVGQGCHFLRVARGLRFAQFL
jgi:hypothetical protein